MVATGSCNLAEYNENCFKKARAEPLFGADKQIRPQHIQALEPYDRRALRGTREGWSKTGSGGQSQCSASQKNLNKQGDGPKGRIFPAAIFIRKPEAVFGMCQNGSPQKGRDE